MSESRSNESQKLIFKDVFGSAWQLVKGYKCTFWGGIFFVVLVSLIIWGVLSCFAYYAIHFAGVSKDTATSVSSIVRTFFTLPAYVGLYLLGIKRAGGLPIRSLDVLKYYPYILGLFGVYLLQMIIMAILGAFIGVSIIFIDFKSHIIISIIAVIIAVLIGLFILYLSIGYIFSLVVRIEKKLGFWRCLETSRKGVSRQWFLVFFILIVSSLLCLFAAIPLLIGLIWVLPWVNLVSGVMYVRLFGPINSANL